MAVSQRTMVIVWSIELQSRLCSVYFMLSIYTTYIVHKGISGLSPECRQAALLSEKNVVVVVVVVFLVFNLPFSCPFPVFIFYFFCLFF